MYFIGIDPGLRGGVGVLQNHRFAAAYDVPIVSLATRAKRMRHEYDVKGMADLLSPFVGRAVYVLLEEAQAMPGQGVRSMFTTGVGFGLWLGLLAAYEFPYTRVRPVVWKRALKLSKDKEQSRLRALQLFPTADLHLKRHHGRAEALLLAWWGVKTWQRPV